MMDAFNSPTLRAHNLIQGRVAEIKMRLDDVRQEAVTGRAADVGRAVDGDIGKVGRLEQSIQYSEGRRDTLAFEGTRAAASQSILTAIRDQAGGVRNALLAAQTEETGQAMSVVQERSSAALTDTLARLNTEFAGRALFGGDEAGVPFGSADDLMTEMRTIYAAAPDTATALTQINDWFDDAAGGFATSFFKGGAGDPPSVELVRGERTQSSTKGDVQEIRDVLKTFALTVLAEDAPDDAGRDALLTAAETGLQSSIDGVVALQASLGVREERIATAQANQSAEAISLKVAYNSLTGRDQAEAATEMRLLESQLEAAYLTTSRMANLSLTNFLR